MTSSRPRLVAVDDLRIAVNIAAFLARFGSPLAKQVLADTNPSRPRRA
jgi:hypothetical protein